MNAMLLVSGSFLHHHLSCLGVAAYACHFAKGYLVGCHCFGHPPVVSLKIGFDQAIPGYTPYVFNAQMAYQLHPNSFFLILI